MNRAKIVFVVGPTAVGKTEVAFCLAQRLRSEIISCDAMQVYQEISIASNKPASELLSHIPHHFVSSISINDESDVFSFRQKVVQVIDRLLTQHKVPVIVGGSGLYMQILLDGIFEDGARNTALRQQLEEKAKREGNETLHAQLKAVDPLAAGRIHLNDTRRIIRALEVYTAQQQPISELQKKRDGLWDRYDVSVYVLDLPWTVLYQRINDRVEKMFEQGLVEEIKKLENRLLSPTAQSMIGVAEVQGYLHGQYDLERAKYLMKLNTRHLAKRQLTWFRKDQRFTWLMMDPGESPQVVTEKILSDLKPEENP